MPRSLLPDEVREFVEERLEGLLEVPVEFVRAARASAAPELDRALLTEEAERELAEGLTRVEVDGDVQRALESGATLAPLMERFFDEVLVMDEDEAVRANRLRLLLDVRDVLGRLGDFSQIPR